MPNDYQELPDSDEFDPGYKDLPDEDEFGGSVWLKFRHKWAHGHEKEWDWRESPDGEPLRHALDEICSQNNWSDKYRGIEYEVHPIPEQAWLDKEIMSCQERAESWKRRSEQLKQLKQQHYGGNLMTLAICSYMGEAVHLVYVADEQQAFETLTGNDWPESGEPEEWECTIITMQPGDTLDLSRYV